MPSDSIPFDRAAGFYDETRGFPPGEERAAAGLFVAAGDLGARSRVLEVGVGTGRIALPLADRVGVMIGVDLSAPMLARLHAKRRDEPLHPLRGDATRLPFAAATFDAVIAVHVFHLIPGWQRALREVARVLRPGGCLLSGFNDWLRDGPVQAVLGPVWRAAVGEDNFTPNVGVPRAEYRTFLEESGWRPAAEAHVHTYATTESARRYLDHLERRVWSSLWRIPDDAWARGVQAVRDAVARHFPDPDAATTIERRFTVRAYLPPGRAYPTAT
jgi:ubiquinone/menaquinone biosynthesis C-methylase UbiE